MLGYFAWCQVHKAVNCKLKQFARRCYAEVRQPGVAVYKRISLCDKQTYMIKNNKSVNRVNGMFVVT